VEGQLIDAPMIDHARAVAQAAGRHEADRSAPARS
jgi:hypothetical protein